MRINGTTYYCVECDAHFCSICQSSHAISHATHLVRFSHQHWSQSMTIVAEHASCSECSLEVRCRIECLVCSRAICYDCYEHSDRRLPWYQHRLEHGKGNGILATIAPTHSVIPPGDHRCDCFQPTGCLGHCGRCSECT